ncbi:oxidoreductase [Histoplasma capsulatum G186AR]|uniref:Oxidoreductase n=1 Tax=Ajellomyces capsulatus TaxID=5037 RepID=A0A8H7YG90_AJECA|nr:oxidoreductase [Histoplasma capsulatum]QSS72619.1 oxidoreductase [Histoplasma capsulatum G186AR]
MENNDSGYEYALTSLPHYDQILATTRGTVNINPDEKHLRFLVRGDKGSLKRHCFPFGLAQLSIESTNEANPVPVLSRHPRRAAESRTYAWRPRLWRGT